MRSEEIIVGIPIFLADAFALGDQVIALSGGKAYEVVPSNVPVKIATVTPTPTQNHPGVTSTARVSPTDPTSTPAQTPPEKSSGLCGAGFLPLIVLPLLLIFVKKQQKSQ